MENKKLSIKNSVVLVILGAFGVSYVAQSNFSSSFAKRVVCACCGSSNKCNCANVAFEKSAQN